MVAGDLDVDMQDVDTDLLIKAFETLPPFEMLLLWCYFIERNLTMRELAERVGVNRQRIDAMLKRSARRARENYRVLETHKSKRVTTCNWCGSAITEAGALYNRDADDGRNLCTTCRRNMKKLSQEKIAARDKAARQNEKEQNSGQT